MFPRKKAPRTPTVTRKRLQRLPLAEVYDWSEVLVLNLGHTLGSWRRGGGLAAVDDMENQLKALLEVCGELRARERLRA